MIPQQSGIYSIVNLTNGKVYVGSAFNLYMRWAQHKSNLKLNKHPSRYLQSAWNKYGEASFEFKILELVANRKNLASREQHWIDETKCYDREVGYNSRVKAENNFGLVPSLEHRAKLSLAITGLVRSNQTKARMSVWQIGRKMSEASKVKNAQSTRNFDKWPHADGAFCKCRDCTTQRTDIHRDYAKVKKLKKSRIFVSEFAVGAMGMGA